MFASVIKQGARTRLRPTVVAMAVLLGASAGVVLTASPGHAAVTCHTTGVVTDLGDSGGPNQLRAELAAACPGGAVRVMPGTIVLQQGQLNLGEDVIVSGLGTVIDGNGRSRVFNIYNRANVTLKDLTVTHGTADAGGGILNTGALTLVHTTVMSNLAVGNPTGSVGGGISQTGIAGGPVSLRLSDGSIVLGNAAAVAGGGIANTACGGNASVTIDESSVTGNAVTNPTGTFGSVGGGILNTTFTDAPVCSGGGVASVVLDDGASVDHNSAPTAAGGIINNTSGPGAATVTLNDGSGIRDNTAGVGGGVLNTTNFPSAPTTAVVRLSDDSTVSNNTASQVGGGILNSAVGATGSTTKVALQDASTVTMNTAPFGGGGIWTTQPAVVTGAAGRVTGNVVNDCGPAAC
jgi:hypothetical protein